MNLFAKSSIIEIIISIAIIRALAPLVTALIAAGKVGSNMGAELGFMKVTEQIDAMEVSGTNITAFTTNLKAASKKINQKKRSKHIVE